MQNDVRAMRSQRGLSQGQLAEAMGVSRQTINSIETERYTPSLPLAIAGPAADERWRSIDLRATAISGLAVIIAVIVAFVWEIAHGRSGQPFALLGAIAGVSYLLSLVWLRWRA